MVEKLVAPTLCLYEAQMDEVRPLLDRVPFLEAGPKSKGYAKFRAMEDFELYCTKLGELKATSLQKRRPVEHARPMPPDATIPDQATLDQKYF